jgi:predicted RNA binding protein YcfA (HicA-like mRNA interferase family)
MPMSGKEMRRLYEKHGWVAVRQNGSHLSMRKGELRETIPMHRELGTGMERRLLKKLGVKK